MNDMRNLQKLATESVPRDGEAAVRFVRAWAVMDLYADAQNMQPTRSAASGAGERTAGVAQVAGAVIVNHRRQVGGRDGQIVPNVQIAPVLAVDFYRGAK